jgi:Ulp1 family protease
MESKRIFSLDSKNSYTECRDKANLVIEALKKNFDIDLQWVHLRSPSQRDGYSCGIFAALNAAFMLQSILEGSFTEKGPATLETWSRKVFSEEDKANIRRCAKDVIYGVDDGAALINWIN